MINWLNSLIFILNNNYKLFSNMSAYPPALKTVLKAVPCIMMCMGMTTITYLYMHGLMRHSQDHVPKHTYRYLIAYWRSTRFGKLVRFRDETNRRYLDPAIKKDPNMM